MSDVKKIDISAVNKIAKALDGSKDYFGTYTKTKEYEQKVEKLQKEEKKSDNPFIGFVEDVKDAGSDFIEGAIDVGNDFLDGAKDVGNYFIEGAKDVGGAIVDKIDSTLGKYEWYQEFSDFATDNILPLAEKGMDVLKKTMATVGTFKTSLAEGVANVGEALFDLGNFGRTVALTAPAAIVDGGQAIYGLITGNEWESVTKKLWEGTKSFVSKDFTSDIFNLFYEKTNYGEFLKDNSYGFETTRSLGSGLGKVAGVVAISYASGGTLAPYAVASLTGFSEGAEKSWGEGATLGEGLLAAAGNSAWEGIQWYVGGKIGGANIFGEGGKALTNMSSNSIKTKLLNSISRVFMDGVDGGAEGFVQPLITAIYKDGYYDEDGNYIEFKDSDNFLDRYGEVFDDYGGYKNVLTNAAIGGGASIFGEVFDFNKLFNKDAGSEVTAKLTGSEITAPLKTGSEVTAKLQNENQSGYSVKSLYDGTNYKQNRWNYQSKIAQYFNDPKQFMFSKLASIADVHKKNTKLVNELWQIVNTPVREIDADELFKKYSKYLSREDKKILKQLIKNDKLSNTYTDIEQDLMQSYTANSGPYITAYNRKTTTNFAGTNINGTNKAGINNSLSKAFNALRKYIRLKEYIDVDKFCNAIDNIIEKSPVLKEDLKVYRSVGSLFMDGKKIMNFDVGTRFNDQAFVSTSVVPTNISTRSPICLEIEIPKGTKALYLERFTGLRGYNQQELLLGRNHEFEIIAPLQLNAAGQKILKARLIPKEQSVIKSLSLDTINSNDVALNYYDKFVRKGTEFDNKQIDINDMMTTFKGKGLLGRYEAEIRDFYNNNLYNIDIPEHNIDHVERVLFYSMYMGEELGLTPQQMNLLVEAAKYHDSGRIDLRTDKNHAELSAIKSLEDLKGKYDSKELDTIAAIIEYHEARDTAGELNRIFSKYNISPSEANDVYKIATILKDADALDRVRFPNNLNIKYLRNDLASRLVKSSYQIQELRAHKAIENDFLNNKYSTKEMDNIVALKESGVPDYLIYYYNRYRTAPVYKMIMKILGYDV